MIAVGRPSWLFAAALLIAVAPAVAQISAAPNASDELGAQIDDLKRVAEDAKVAAERANLQAQKSLRQAEALARTAKDDRNRSESQRIAAESKAAEALAQSRRDSEMAMAAMRDARKAIGELSRAEARVRKADDATRLAEADAAQARRNAAIAVGSGIIAVLMVVGIGYTVMRRIKAKRPDPVSNCVLNSSKMNLQLSGRQLPEAAGGVVVGRNPKDASAVINRNEVSRRHARFFHRDGRYWVEDTDSLGGTAVDEIRLDPGIPVAIDDGAVVAFAGLEFTFRVDD